MSRRLLAGTVLLGASILVAVFSLAKRTPVYARSVAEFVAHPIRGQKVRIQGALVPGSLVREAEPCAYQFRLAEPWSPLAEVKPDAPPAQLSVHHPGCLVPDTFRDLPGLEMLVAVEGELCESCHRFEASHILTKAPHKYEIELRRGGDAATAPTGL